MAGQARSRFGECSWVSANDSGAGAFRLNLERRSWIIIMDRIYRRCSHGKKISFADTWGIRKASGELSQMSMNPSAHIIRGQ